MPKKYRRLLIALAAVASLYLVKATGLDQGLIDEILDSAIEAVTEDAPTTAPLEADMPFEAMPEVEPQPAGDSK